MTNSKEFLTAAEYVKKLKKMPSDDEMLCIYKYFKQATLGDNNTSRPGMLNFKGVTKWEAWNSVKGTSTHNSEVEYIKLVNQVINKYGIN